MFAMEKTEILTQGQLLTDWLAAGTQMAQRERMPTHLQSCVWTPSLASRNWQPVDTTKNTSNKKHEKRGSKLAEITSITS